MDGNASSSPFPSISPSSSSSLSSSSDAEMYTLGYLIFGIVAYFFAFLFLLHSLITLMKSYNNWLAPRIWIFISLCLSCILIFTSCILYLFYDNATVLPDVLFKIGNNMIPCAALFVGALWVKLMNLVLYKNFSVHMNNEYTTGEMVVLFVFQPLNVIRLIVAITVTIVTGKKLIYNLIFLVTVFLITFSGLVYATIIFVKLRKEQELSSKRPALLKMTKMIFFIILFIIAYFVYYISYTYSSTATPNDELIVNLVYGLLLYFMFSFGFGAGVLNSLFNEFRKKLGPRLHSSSSGNLPEQLKELDCANRGGVEVIP